MGFSIKIPMKNMYIDIMLMWRKKKVTNSFIMFSLTIFRSAQFKIKLEGNDVHVSALPTL